MFILKNAYKSIVRAKGRNILMIIIISVIMISAAISLSIKNAADSAATEGLNNTKITATVGVNREKLMQEAQENSGGEGGGRQMFSVALDSGTDLSMEDYKQIGGLSEVESTYYNISVSLSSKSDIAPVESSSSSEQGGPGGGQMRAIGSMVNGDFTVTGFSSDSAVANAPNGTFSLTDGVVFSDYDTANYEAVISDNLATYNGLKVGDTFTLTNPNHSSEKYKFKIVGIYKNSTSSSSEGGSTMNSSDPDNNIYANVATVNSIVSKSEKKAVQVESPISKMMGGGAGPDDQSSDSSESSTEMISSALSGTTTYSYVLANKSDYDAFVNSVAGLTLTSGKDIANYAVSSADVSNYEASIVPLQNLSKFASTLLLIILLVGAVILIVLNLFNIRERKYEVGVYTAMGIKKPKVIAQFALELLMVAMLSVGIGAVVGAVASVPVSNAMLKSQISATESQSSQQAGQFGRQMQAPGGGGAPGGNATIITRGANTGANNNVEYVSQIGNAIDIKILLELVGIGLVLSIISSIGGSIFVSRYEPLQILADRS